MYQTESSVMSKMKTTKYLEKRPSAKEIAQIEEQATLEIRILKFLTKKERVILTKKRMPI